MKLLYLPAYYSPEHAASTYIGKNRNRALVKAGYDFTIIAPTPCRGISESVRKEYKNRKHEVTNNGHTEIIRFSMFKEGKNPIIRALRYFFCCCAQYRLGLKAKDISCIMVSSTPPIQGMMAALLKKRKKVPFIYNLQDIFPDSLVATGLTKKGSLTWKIGRKIEDFTYRNADKIIVISNDFKKNIMEKGVPGEKISLIYNWVEENAVVDIDRKDNILFDRYGLDRNKFYVTYNGNIGMTQNLDLLLKVAKELEEYKDICFVLVGNGAYRDTLEKRIAKENIANIKLLPFQPYEEISYVFSLGDVSIVISKPGVGANSVPSKTWSIMSASRPVLANFDENELKDIIENNGCGIFTKAGDKNTFKNAIIKLYEHPALRLEYGRNGRKFIMDNLTKEIGTSKYVETFNSITKK